MTAVTKLIESIRHKDWHSANEAFSEAIAAKKKAKLVEMRKHLNEEDDEEKCEACGKPVSECNAITKAQVEKGK